MAKKKDPKRVAAGKKAAQTRKRRAAARKAAATRKANQAKARREFERRSIAAKKGVETRRRNERRRLREQKKALDKVKPKNGSGDVEVRIDADMGNMPVAIRVLEERIEKACQLAAKELAEMGAAHARAEAPVRKGTLRNSIGIQPSDDPEVWYVAATAPHAAIRHMGVKKHYIIKKDPGFMRFHPGTFVYARRWSGVRGPQEPGPGRAHEVHFIGSKASPFMRNAAAAVRAEGGKRAARIVRSAV